MKRNYKTLVNKELECRAIWLIDKDDGFAFCHIEIDGIEYTIKISEKMLLTINSDELNTEVFNAIIAIFTSEYCKAVYEREF